MKKKVIAFVVLLMMLFVPAAEAGVKDFFKKTGNTVKKGVKKVKNKFKKKKKSFIYDASGNKVCFTFDEKITPLA